MDIPSPFEGLYLDRNLVCEFLHSSLAFISPPKKLSSIGVTEAQSNPLGGGTLKKSRVWSSSNLAPQLIMQLTICMVSRLCLKWTCCIVSAGIFMVGLGRQ